MLLFQFQPGSIRSGGVVGAQHPLAGFNSSLVLLEVEVSAPAAMRLLRENRFQFQPGSIRSRGRPTVLTVSRYCFNSSLVLLEELLL